MHLLIVHSKKTDPWQPQLVGWYERRPLHDPNMVFAYWSKKKTTMFSAKTIVLSWYWVLFPAPAVWTPLCLAAQSTSFLLLSIFRLHGCYFSGWPGSPVDSYWFQIHQPSRSTTVTISKRGRDVWGNPYALLQRDKEGGHPKSMSALTKRKEKVQVLLYHHILNFLLSSSLHRTGAVAVQSHRRLAFARRRWDWYMYNAHLQWTLACGWKDKTTDFHAKSTFPKVEHTWNWYVRRTKAALRPGKKKTGISFKTFEKSQIHLRDQFFWNGL